MKIAIASVTAGGMSGGYRKYLQELVPRLQQMDDVSFLKVLVPPSTLLPGIEEKSVVAWPSNNYVATHRWLQDWVAAVRPDVVFVPTARWLRLGSPTVVMVRNMEPLVTPFDGNPLPEWVRNIVRARAAKRACRRSNRVIAVSEFVHSFLQSRWRIHPDKLGLVYHGVTLPPAGNGSGVAPPIVAAMSRPFLFTAGSIRPARGLEDLVAALGNLNRPELLLIVAGGLDSGMAFYQRDLQTLAEREGVADRIVWAGSLSAAEMQWCYQRSAAFVMTTRTEACPNIALEAMANGALIVSTDDAPMPEMFGEAALFYSARDPRSLSESLETILDRSERERNATRTRSVERARQFSWDRCAQQTLGQLQKAIG